MTQKNRPPRTEEAEYLLRLAGLDEKAFHALLNASETLTTHALFHAQQAVEKILKAVLVSHDVVFRRTHDLVELADLLTARGIELPVPRERLASLSAHAVRFRYEEDGEPLLAGNEAATILQTVRDWANKITR